METRTHIEPYTQTVREVLDSMNVPHQGIGEQDVVQRRELHGANVLPEAKRANWFELFIRQFQSPLIYILLVSSIIVFFIGEHIDALVIMSVLVINAVIGMIQEGKAEDTLKALRTFTKTESRVRRGEKEIVIVDSDIVQGDIVLLSEGEKIPADGRVLWAKDFQVDEAALTGESVPVVKHNEPITQKVTGTGDMKNMLFKGTYVVSGRAEYVVTAVGVNTIIGSLSVELSRITTDVPLKKNIEHIAKIMTAVILVVSALIFAVGLYLGNSVSSMFLTSVAIAVSVIPEGLPIVITLVLATGVYRMGKQNALVKKLQAVEALGRADVICVDKTGTITKNELMVSSVYIDGVLYSIEGSGYEARGDVVQDGQVVNPLEHVNLILAGKIASYCANATVSFKEKEGVWRVIGDPTEAALLVLGEKIGFIKEIVEKENPSIFDIPFNYENKYHATIHRNESANFMTVVGAPEPLIESAHYIIEKGKKKRITEKDRKHMLHQLHTMAADGLRVVAFGYNPDVPETVTAGELPPLILGGLYGLDDTLREGVADAVSLAKKEGIAVALITGDFPKTAEAIAQKAGIFSPGDEIITGKELLELNDEELLERLPRTTVFARVSPQDKLRIVSLYKKRGDIVAMTGDGVNDALSLVAADLGIAMGKIGTEVTKEAADIILLDDNFGSIVSAIEEGRSIFATIKKVLLYLFSTGFGELFTIIFGLIVLALLPLLPSQIIWLNLVTDSFLVIAFAFEPKEKIGLGRKVRKGVKQLIDALMIERVLIMALVMSIGSIFIFKMSLDSGSLDFARTMALTLLAVYQWINVWNCRSESRSVVAQNPLSNMYFVYAFVIVVVLHMGLLYLPFMQSIFSTVPLSLEQWGIIALFAVPLIVIEEARKLIHRLFTYAKIKYIAI